MEKKESRDPISCYCLKTRRVSAVITKFYDKMLEPCGLTVRQYSLLLYLSQAESCSVRELADMAELDRSTLARSLKPLFHQGLIVNASTPGARNSQLELTKVGLETLGQAKRLWAEAQSALAHRFGDEGLRALETVFQSLESL